jgi:DHA1 family multidrug resistance protein-like MFS transporter
VTSRVLPFNKIDIFEPTTLRMHDNQQAPLDHAASSSHTKPHPDSHPPFLNRDGYLDFAPGDSAHPLNWSTTRKYYITGVAILLVVNATFASSAPTGAFQGMIKDLDISNEVVGLVTTLFLLGYCTGPLVWAPISEYYG